MPKHRSPEAILGRKACFCSSVPNRSSDGAIWRSATHCAATGAPMASSSSVTAKRSRNVRPCPPYSVGIVMPTQPRAASFFVKSLSQRVSHVSTHGVKVPAAASRRRKLRTSSLSARVCSSSVTSCGTSCPPIRVSPQSSSEPRDCLCTATDLTH